MQKKTSTSRLQDFIFVLRGKWNLAVTRMTNTNIHTGLDTDTRHTYNLPPPPPFPHTPPQTCIMPVYRCEDINTPYHRSRSTWSTMGEQKNTYVKNAVRTGHKSMQYLSYLSRSLADRWGTTVDFTTSFLHSSRFSAFRSSIIHSRPVHSLMLSFHRLIRLPLCLPHWTVPRRIVLAGPDDRVTCPYHFSLRLFAKVRRSSYGPMAFPILVFTSSLVMWSLYEIPRSLRKHLLSNACILHACSTGVEKRYLVTEWQVHLHANLTSATQRATSGTGRRVVKRLACLLS